ncbi:hypothetical protein [Burkholderia sp. Bp8963]|uniref:hypothetical protein n=1 Tax=Burkholderia sp. Bp8963 TaxID=2184547 RepID=UPI000F5B5F6A|nr:hypothetical protein [Burkholderia sp. Bp8963]
MPRATCTLDPYNARRNTHHVGRMKTPAKEMVWEDQTSSRFNLARRAMHNGGNQIEFRFFS